MNFLFPAFLAGAVAIAIPIVLHFLRRDVAPEVPFTAVRLLQKSPIERSHRRRLRDLLLLAARVAALLLLALAFARPYIIGAAGSASALRIVAVDRSFSMGAPGRFERARQLARAAIDEAGAGERVALVAFDDRAEVLAGPGAGSEVRAALNGLQPGNGATRYASVLAKAIEVAGGAAATVVVVSDLQRVGWEDERRAIVPASLKLDIRDTGPVESNLAVAAVRLEADRLIATIRNSGPRRDGQVKILRDGQIVATASYVAGVDASVEVPVAFRAPATGSIVVQIDDADGFAADNSRYVVLDRASRASVLIVTTSGAVDSAFYLTRALAVASGSELAGGGLDTRVVNGAALSAMDADQLSRYSAVILLSTHAFDRRARENLNLVARRGAGVLVAAAADVEPAVLSSVFDWTPPLSGVEQAPERITLAATDLRHPIFRPFGAIAANLGQVRFDRAWRVGAEGWEVAARFTDGSPALLERRAGDGRIVLFASDFDRRWNDFPLHPAFVPFAVEAVRYAMGAADQAMDYVVASAPAGTPPQPGVYLAQPGNRTVSVNVDPLESSVARLSGEDFVAMVDRVGAPAERPDARAKETEAGQGYWRYGLLLMIAALVAESVVGRA